MRARTTARRPAGRLAVSVVGTPAGLRVAAGLACWLEQAAPRAARGAVAVALVTDARMRALNRTFRGVDRPTDVLSFPAHDGGNKSFEYNDLGDIAIAIGVAGRQARTEGHVVRTEIRILALHGLLHLLGYDHERDRGRMQRIEERLRRRAGLPAGLIARSPRFAHR
jgi:probable rRNA maturation factor